MKTWQQFVEDLQTYARDKEAYERATASAEKINAKRRDALKRSKVNPKKFSKKSVLTHKNEKEKAESLKNEYNKNKTGLSLANKKNIQFRQKIKNRYKNTSGSSKELYDGTKKVVKGAIGLVNRMRNRQNPN